MRLMCFFVLFILFYSLVGKGQTDAKHFVDSLQKLQASDTLIVWNKSRKLSIGDFRGKYGSLSNANAMSYCDFVSFFNSDDGVFKARIVCVFNKTASWVRPFTLNSYIIAHEQCHFDITEMFARKLTNRLNALSLEDLKLNEKISKLYMETCKELDSTQSKFDNETSGTYDSTNQRIWIKSLDRILKK